MKDRIFLSIILAGLIFPTITRAQQNVRIKDIFDNPAKYENEQVTIKGIVNQYYESTTKTTSYYQVQGDYGDVINVNTSNKPPLVTKKYEITGVVINDQVSGRPVLIEQSRTLIDKGSIIIYVLIALVLILVVFLGLYLYRGKDVTSKHVQEVYKPSQNTVLSTNSSGNDFETIRIKTGVPPTMLLLPGEMEIISGPDKGKTFRIAGFPASEGAKVTIGRDAVEGERNHAHIQLLEKTVSRKQAELTFKNNTLYVKNLSETNFTQLEGRELSLNEEAELKSGMILRTGEVEFRYKK